MTTLPPRAVARAMDPGEPETHYARHEGYVEGWNECLDAVERNADVRAPARIRDAALRDAWNAINATIVRPDPHHGVDVPGTGTDLLSIQNGLIQATNIINNLIKAGTPT